MPQTTLPYTPCHCGSKCSAYFSDEDIALFEISRGPCYGQVSMIDEIEIAPGEWEEVHCCENPAHLAYLDG